MQNDVISKRISKALKNANLSQRKLAEMTGLTAAAISQYAKGTIRPTEENLIKIARALNVSPIWLHGYDNEYQALALEQMAKNKRIINLFESLNNQGKDKVIEYAEDIMPKYGKEK